MKFGLELVYFVLTPDSITCKDLGYDDLLLTPFLYGQFVKLLSSIWWHFFPAMYWKRKWCSVIIRLIQYLSFLHLYEFWLQYISKFCVGCSFVYFWPDYKFKSLLGCIFDPSICQWVFYVPNCCMFGLQYSTPSCAYPRPFWGGMTSLGVAARPFDIYVRVDY